MDNKRKQPNEPAPENDRRGADENLELAKILIGQISVSDQEFFERMARSAEFVIEDPETCGITGKMLKEYLRAAKRARIERPLGRQRSPRELRANGLASIQLRQENPRHLLSAVRWLADRAALRPGHQLLWQR